MRRRVSSWAGNRYRLEPREQEAPSRVSSDVQIQRQFWLGHFRIGFGVFVGEAIFALVRNPFT